MPQAAATTRIDRSQMRVSFTCWQRAHGTSCSSYSCWYLLAGPKHLGCFGRPQSSSCFGERGVLDVNTDITLLPKAVLATVSRTKKATDFQSSGCGDQGLSSVRSPVGSPANLQDLDLCCALPARPSLDAAVQILLVVRQFRPAALLGLVERLPNASPEAIRRLQSGPLVGCACLHLAGMPASAPLSAEPGIRIRQQLQMKPWAWGRQTGSCVRRRQIAPLLLWWTWSLS